MLDDSVLTATSKIVTGLTSNTRYYWRVGSISGVGPGAYSPGRSFRTLATTWIERIEGDVSSRIVLDQNYPNPFNPATTIRYSIPGLSHVTLKVFDMLGAEVLDVVDKTQDVGRYDVRIDTRQLPSGIYIYELRAGAVMQAKKMILAK
jgi:hypothetical protein